MLTSTEVKHIVYQVLLTSTKNQTFRQANWGGLECHYHYVKYVQKLYTGNIGSIIYDCP